MKNEYDKSLRQALLNGNCTEELPLMKSYFPWSEQEIYVLPLLMRTVKYLLDLYDKQKITRNRIAVKLFVTQLLLN